MKNILISLACIVGTISIISFVVYMDISVWYECRADHSWFYCLRVLD